MIDGVPVGGDVDGQPPPVRDEDDDRDDRDERHDDREQLTHQYGVALKTKLTALVSVPLMVTSWLWVPNCSCHAVTVYLPGGSPDKLNAPSASVTEACGVERTTNQPCIHGWTLHFTGMNSGCSNFAWIGGAPSGCDLFHSGFTFARGWMLCEFGSPL